MTDRPSCYPTPGPTLAASVGPGLLPLLDVLSSPVPAGRFDSPVDGRHVLCLHLGGPVPVTYRAGGHERSGVRLHGQFCVVPAGSSTRWTLAKPARSLLLRLSPSLMEEAAGTMGLTAGLDPAIHIRDARIERIGWMMQAEDQDGHPGGRLFADSLASALAARLLALQARHGKAPAAQRHGLPAWKLRRVLEYIEANLDQDLGLQELAAVAGFSLSHFKPLFRASVGMPAHRFVQERRMVRARLHLARSAKSITEIALETGFANPSHLARSLRHAFGMGPSELRAAGR